MFGFGFARLGKLPCYEIKIQAAEMPPVGDDGFPVIFVPGQRR